ncbi:rRNA maturation RNase YbeY [uncultured Roseobacter sp.]|uniref:rRNA maturation RNase YbeY n=1 Tax=uncultured Roseobacter sp. TaxID=114847 RepID=UPI00261F5A74|nr:rRNA maturation RNase YbeY [uncultured Roseobacter sp.]
MSTEPLLEIAIDAPQWETLPLEDLCVRAAAATLDWLGLNGAPASISVLACDDTRIAALNGDFRDKPTPTNVLSWPAEDLAPEAPGGRPLPPGPDPEGVLALGDIAIAYETCAREAAEMGKPLADHVTHLVVHGILHLLGYDHIDDADAAVMEQLEIEILGKMGLNDPYRI